MLVRLLLILVVAFVLVTVESKASEKNNKKNSDTSEALHPPCICSSCRAAEKELYSCLQERNGTKYYEKFVEYGIAQNIEKRVNVTEKLIEQKCIRQEYVDDVRCLMKIVTPPDCYIKVYAELSEEEKMILKDYELNRNCTECKTAAVQVSNKILKKMKNFTDAEYEEVQDWTMDIIRGCADMNPYVYLLSDYGNDTHYPGSNTAFMKYYGR